MAAVRFGIVAALICPVLRWRRSEPRARGRDAYVRTQRGVLPYDDRKPYRLGRAGTQRRSF